MKKALAILALTSITISMCAACTKTGSKPGEYKASDYPEEITVDVFDTLSNFQGIQSGWFADVVKKKFNMKLNIIAPNRSYNGSVLQDVRTASGNLGDLIICSAENNALAGMVESGLLTDMSGYFKNKDIMRYTTAIENLNAGFSEAGIYAVPSEMSTLSAFTPQNIQEPTYSPYIRWDLYAQLGYPEINTLEDLLPVLEKMQMADSQTASGQKTYAFSFFDDWDDNMMNAAKQPCCFYGYDESGFVLAKADGSDYQDILDPDSLYMRVLRFYYNANQKGLVDPDSQTQNYSEVFKKYQDGQILFSPWPFLGQSAYNTQEHMDQGNGFMAVNIRDMKIYSKGCSQTGDLKSVIAIGSDAEDPQRLADFIDWLYSDEGVYDSQAQPNDGSAGPEGICWQMGTNGPELTEYGRKTFLEKQNNPIPGEEKLGTFRDGVSQLNYTAILLNQEDQRGYPFSYHMWETEKSRSKTLLQKEWSQYMNATDTMDYLQKNDKLLISPGCTYNAPEADSDVKEIRAACKKIIIRDSWKMIFAPNQNKFDALMENMRKQCLGLGYDKVCQYDLKNAKAYGEMKQQIIAKKTGD